MRLLFSYNLMVYNINLTIFLRWFFCLNTYLRKEKMSILDHIKENKMEAAGVLFFIIFLIFISVCKVYISNWGYKLETKLQG